MVSQKKKKYIRRKLAQAIGHQQSCVSCLLEVREFFVEYHPEWEELFVSIGNMCMMSIGFIRTVGIRAYGYFPENINTWLK